VCGHSLNDRSRSVNPFPDRLFALPSMVGIDKFRSITGCDSHSACLCHCSSTFAQRVMMIDAPAKLASFAFKCGFTTRILPHTWSTGIDQCTPRVLVIASSHVCVSLFYVIDTGSTGSRARHHVTLGDLKNKHSTHTRAGVYPYIYPSPLAQTLAMPTCVLYLLSIVESTSPNRYMALS